MGMVEELLQKLKKQKEEQKKQPKMDSIFNMQLLQTKLHQVFSLFNF